MPDYRDTLRDIRTFPQLIKFLRDELDWPIDSDDFEELTFDYTPEELGIDTASAAKIQEIKRLRPLSVNQPWGIFFIKFEPKQLPVAVLRRVLSRVAMKKRASANSAERAAWQADDLLFVSNYGEGDERRITFAHFAQNAQKSDLPTLKVLGWDNRDTALHLDSVADVFAEKLAWPNDEEDVESWRESWRSAFTLRHREVITTSKALAVKLAELARAIRDRINTVLKIETKNGPVTKLMKAFQEALVHDLDADGFADMYAQTIAYGLLSARVTNPKANTADGFAMQLPVTNPFLKELMETFLHVGGRRGKANRGAGIDFDELGVSEVVELLDDANMEAVIRDFGDKNPQEDPVIHFYELFLKEYDAKKRMQRGVFYTPRPVVSYIVRSVHELLQTEFGLADGLADTTTWGEMAKRHEGLKIPDGVKPTDRFVTILDPATGTGTFLVEVIEVIHRTLVEKWKQKGHGEQKVLDLWNDYVPNHLLPRLHGYELLMAPYAIAHLKIGLKLHETGYRFGSGERVRIYLTNSLEPAHDFSGQFEFMIPALAHEAEAVNAVKRHQRFTVVIGNPPYSFRSTNKSGFIMGLLEDYRKGLNERKPQLNDDYVKFLRLAQHLLSSQSLGLLGMITNNSYLYGVTHWRMRESLCESFSAVRVVDLGGDVKLSDPAIDQNVFDIQQGVCIGIFLRKPSSSNEIRYARVAGAREEKYGILSSVIQKQLLLESLDIIPPYYFTKLSPTSASNYLSWPSLTELFPAYINGVVTSRDSFCIDTSRARLKIRLEDFASLDVSDLLKKYEDRDLRDNTSVDIRTAKRNLRQTPDVVDTCITKCAFRPFDERHLAFNRNFIHRTREEVMKHLLRKNTGLIFNRSVRGDVPCHFFVVQHVVMKEVISSKDNSYVAPLYLYDESDGELLVDRARKINISRKVADWWKAINQTSAPVCGELFLGYVYALLYSPAYRLFYRQQLTGDFPHLPLTSSLELFRELAWLGGELVAHHLVEAPAQQSLSARYDKAAKAWRYEVAKKLRLPVTLSFTGPNKPVVCKVGWSNNTVWIDAVKPKKDAADARVTGTVGFRGVPEDVWHFHIGGYQVCEKWLKDRRDRTLTAEDIAHYHRIVIALHETIRIMREIDEVIDAHGGWPGAFAAASQDSTTKGTTGSRIHQGRKKASAQADLQQPNLFG